MSIYIELIPELVRMAQLKSRATGQPVANELARMVAEESIINLDPELDLVIEGASSLQELDAVISAVGVNSVMVNAREIDVRVLDDDNRVYAHRALVGTPYMAAGSIIVKMEGTKGGKVVGHVGPGLWLKEESRAGNDEYVSIEVTLSPDFDLAGTLSSITRAPKIDFSQGLRSMPDDKEFAKFLFKRGQMIMARQKQVITALHTSDRAREAFLSVSESLPPQKVTLVLNQSAVWAERVESTVVKLEERFPQIKRDEIVKVVLAAGERFGGQPDAPEFRRHVATSLAETELSLKFSGERLARLKTVLNEVLSGKTAQEAVGKFVKNDVALKVAQMIREKRSNLDAFAKATADEIGMAFGQLALQPAYQTHSTTSESGVESINEAIELLEATAVAEKIEEMDFVLAGQ